MPARESFVALLNAVPGPIAAAFRPGAPLTRALRPLVNRLLPAGPTAVVVCSRPAKGLRLLIDTLDVHRFLEILAAHPVLPLAEALPRNDETLTVLLADLTRGETSTHAEALRAVSADLLIPVEELARRAEFVLACLVLPTSGAHYAMLGVAPDAATAEICKRWAALIRRYHPDHLGGTGASGWLESPRSPSAPSSPGPRPSPSWSSPRRSPYCSAPPTTNSAGDGFPGCRIACAGGAPKTWLFGAWSQS